MSEEDQKEDGSVEVELKEEASVAAVEKPEQTVSKEATPPEENELAEYSDTVKRRIDKLTYKAREAERQRDAAIEYAKSLKQQAEVAESRSTQFAKSLTTEYETRIQTQEQLVNDRLRRAIDRGDIDEQILAQRALAELTVEKERLKGNVFRAPAEKEVQQPVYAPPPVQQPAQPRPDPKAEQWAEKNTWFGADQPMTLTAFSHHRDMVEKEGFDPQSDDYYDELDKRMRRDFPHKFQQQAQRTAPMQAVASGRLPVRADNVQKIKLKPSEVAIAKRLGVKLEEYARQVKKLQGNV